MSFIFVLTLAAPAHATGTGTLVGTATDQDGRPVAQAQLRLMDAVAGKLLAARRVRGNASYAFESVPEGVYYLTSQADGYRPLVSKTVTVKAGETIPLDLVFQTEPGWVARVFTSGAALWSLFASLVLTIWGPRLYAYFHRPRLALVIEARQPHSHWIRPLFPAPTGAPLESKPIDIYFCRVHVQNNGKTEAEKVEVTVRKIFKHEDGWKPQPFVPLNLRWSNTWDILKAGEDVPGDAKVLVNDRISAGGGRFCDLGFVVDPHRYTDFCLRAKFRDRPSNPTSAQDSQVRFLFAFEFIRDLERHRLTPGEYWLEVVADAIRIHPKSFWIGLRIPDAVAAPKDEEERKHSITRFAAECREERPADVPAISPPGPVRRLLLRLLPRRFRAPFPPG